MRPALLAFGTMLLLGCGGPAQPAATVASPGTPWVDQCPQETHFKFQEGYSSKDVESEVDIEFRTVARRAFVVEGRCGQGPYEIRIKATGSPWLERITVIARTNHPIRGHAYTFQPSMPTSDSPSSNIWGWDPPENSACVASASEVATSGAGKGSGTGPNAPGGAHEGPSTSVPEPMMKAPASSLREVPVPSRWPLGCSHVAYIMWQSDSDKRAASTAAGEVVFRLWSLEPNDYEGTVFEVIDQVGDPKMSDGAFAAKLKQATELAGAKFMAKAKAKKELCDKQPSDPVCQEPSSHPSYATTAATASEPQTPPPPPKTEAAPPKPSTHAEWRPGYWHWTATIWVWISGRWRVPDSDVTSDQTVHAPTAPPSPKAEAKPPQPTPQAHWTPGYWQWSLKVWVWIDGSWQIPPSTKQTWRADGWKITGSGAVFVPGGWVTTP